MLQTLNSPRQDKTMTTMNEQNFRSKLIFNFLKSFFKMQRCDNRIINVKIHFNQLISECMSADPFLAR